MLAQKNKLTEQLPKILVVAILVGGVLVLVSKLGGPSIDGMVDVKVPNLSALAEKGRKDFEANCVQCHGAHGAGSDMGPPLIHNIYNAGHHGDSAFLLAAKRGVPRHHWNFGNMPPQPQITKEMMKGIVQYVRELQVANGIRYKPHKMN